MQNFGGWSSKNSEDFNAKIFRSNLYLLLSVNATKRLLSIFLHIQVLMKRTIIAMPKNVAQ